MVKYNRQREAAEQAVAGLAGVRDIRDNIKLSYDADPADVTLLVQAALDRNALIRDDSDISVDTHGNTVTLSGQSAPGPNATRWSAPPGWPAASSRSATSLTSPG